MGFSIRDFAEKQVIDINQRYLYPDSVELFILTETGAADDDLFAIPSLIQSGGYNLVGEFAENIKDRYKREKGGLISESSAYFLTDKKYLNSLKNNKSYIKRNGIIFKIVEIIEATGSDEIILNLSKEND